MPNPFCTPNSKHRPQMEIECKGESAPESLAAKTLNLVLRREKHLFELVNTYNHRLYYPVYLMGLWLFNICTRRRKGEQRFRVELLNQYVPQRLRFYRINCGMKKAFRTRFGKITFRLGKRPSSELWWWKYIFGFLRKHVSVDLNFGSLIEAYAKYRMSLLNTYLIILFIFRTKSSLKSAFQMLLV